MKEIETGVELEPSGATVWSLSTSYTNMKFVLTGSDVDKNKVYKFVIQGIYNDGAKSVEHTVTIALECYTVLDDLAFASPPELFNSGTFAFDAPYTAMLSAFNSLKDCPIDMSVASLDSYTVTSSDFRDSSSSDDATITFESDPLTGGSLIAGQVYSV